MTNTFRLRRSELSTPATSERMIVKAAESTADLVFLDLEDSVAPAEKVGARAPVIEALNGLDWGTKTRAVRVNGTHTEYCHGDVVEIVSATKGNLDVIIIPKVKAPRDVWFVDTLLSQLEDELRLPQGGIGVEILIEETEALARVEEIAGCCPRLEALILGVGDLSASQGIRLTPGGEAASRYPGDMWHYARNRMIVAARANGLDAIDGPYANIRKPEGYREECQWSSTLGAVGKWAIHPSQIEIANEVYSPTQAEIERAEAVVKAVHDAEKAGAGAADLNGVMIDAATARIFEIILERAKLCGLA
ncbi:MAG: CoA ester lyase [Actinomycetia bacterium]|nr:CoA ester lyase [Actinomycetes bacterium]